MSEKGSLDCDEVVRRRGEPVSRGDGLLGLPSALSRAVLDLRAVHDLHAVRELRGHAC